MTVSRSVLFRMKNYVDKVIEKIKMHILYSVTFLQGSCCLWGIMEKYGTVREGTDINMIRHMWIAC